LLVVSRSPSDFCGWHSALQIAGERDGT